MDEALNEIKSKIDVVDLVSAYLPLKKAGRNYRAPCPFHREKTPSFMVSQDLQIFKCFGCQEGGDIFAFIMKIEGLDFPAALKLLAERAGVKLKSNQKTGSDSRKERLYQANQLAAEFFNFLLVKHDLGAKARDYLSHRQVLSETTAAFGLGYAPSSWRSLSQFLIKKGFSLSEIIEAGLALPKKSSGQDLPVYDRFRSRLVFPLRDSLGRVLGFSGRALGSDEPKYLNSPETPIFRKGSFLYGLDVTKQEIKRSGQAILVEGQFDLIVPYQQGFRNLVASLGTALTEGQLKLLGRFSQKLVLAFDQDAAGSQALVRSVALAENLGFTVRAVSLPSGTKDPDEAARLRREELAQALAAELPFYDYYLHWLTQDSRALQADQKKDIATKFLNQLARVESPITRSHYLKELSRIIETEVGALAEVLGKLRSGPAAENQKDRLETLAAVLRTSDREELLGRYLLSLLIQAPWDLGREILPKLSAANFSLAPLKSIFSLLKKGPVEKGALVDASSLRAKLDESTRSVFDDLCLLDLGSIPDGRPALSAEANFVVNQLKKETTQREMREISQRIRTAEREGNLAEVELWQHELQKVTEKLK